MKIAIVDTYYPDFLKTLPPPESYEQGLEFALSRFFGTHSAYSRGLAAWGWEAVDIIANYDALEQLYAKEVDMHPAIAAMPDMRALNHIGRIRPDVVFLQDLSFFDVGTLDALKEEYVLAGQCSCRFDDDEKLKRFDVLFTSFPFYVERFRKLGVEGVFLPLAFDPLVLERAEIPPMRTYAVSFVGGYGRHWDMEILLGTLAERTPIQFWGYGFERAPEAIRSHWLGPAWGLDMYEIYLRSHIVVNRHGGIAQGYSNNLRMFEATGCGALLMTERSRNIDDYFAFGEKACYYNPQEAAEKINALLSLPDDLRRIASAGQQRTLSTHTYAQRMPIVSGVLKEKLKQKTVIA